MLVLHRTASCFSFKSQCESVRLAARKKKEMFFLLNTAMRPADFLKEYLLKQNYNYQSSNTWNLKNCFALFLRSVEELVCFFIDGASECYLRKLIF